MSCYFLVSGCNNVTLVGNGFCNDETNNAICNYDGGDCCFNANKDSCSECICFLIELCTAGFYPWFVGDGFCNDEANIVQCNYDGGDCCGSCINKEYCSECSCLNNKTLTNRIPNARVGDGFCNDENNNADCNYDGGDCCGSCINKGIHFWSKLGRFTLISSK